MGAFKSAVITKKGQALTAKIVQGGTKLEFTQIKTSENALSGDLASLTSIGTIKQAEKVASVVRQNDYNVKVSASFSNAGLTSGYYVRNIGLYAMDPDEGEILFSVSVADESNASADWMPPHTGVSVSSLMVDLITAVSNASSVSVVVDPTATATVGQIMEVNERLTALDNSITTTTSTFLNGSVAGGVKVNKVLGKSEQGTTTGKNLLKNVATSQVINGVTFTVKEDGSVVANGTATDLTALTINNISLPNGAYILSGCPKGGAWNTYSLQYKFGSQDAGSGLNLPISDSELKNIRILVYAGVTLSNVVFKPMIRRASISDDTYEPYTGGIPSPNPEYPQEVKNVVVSSIIACGKNLLKATAGTCTIEGITFTKNADGSFTVNGTAVNTAYLLLGSMKYRKDTQYKVSGCPVGGSGDSFFLQANYYAKSGDVVGLRDTGSGATFTSPKDITANVYICVVKGASASNLTFRPMIMEADIENTAYEPYTESTVTLSQPITLRSVDGVTDELTVDGVVRRVASVVLDDSANEEWVASPGHSSADYNAFYVKIVNPPHAGNDCRAYCDRFPWVPYVSVIGTNEHCFSLCDLDGCDVVVKVPNTITDVTAFQDWLNDNHLTLVYPVATPTIEPLPVADQIALRSLVGYDKATHVSTDSTVDPVVEVEYGINKVGAHTLTGLLTAQRNELKLAEIASAMTHE